MPNGLFTLKQQVLAIREGGWPGQPPTSVNYLVVAGGGGGGSQSNTNSFGGGGGAGGLLQGNFPITPGTSYTVTVGAGGTASANAVGTIGGSSVFGVISATGGGYGGRFGDVGAGGSGGGNGNYPFTVSNLNGGQGISGQGNRGGSGTATQTSSDAAGGGGGAGTVGLNGASGIGGNGGAGAASDVSGSRVTYAGGGGGSGYSTQGSGGAGGGGSAAIDAAAAAGATNTGGGGGGGGRVSSNGTGGNGGSGIVIVSYPDIYAAAASTTGSPTVGTSGSGSMLFNGSTQYLSYPDSSNYDVGSGDFTVECFFYPSGSQSSGVVLAAQATNIYYTPWMFYFSTSNALQFYSSSNGSSFDVASGAVIGTYTPNAWNHAVICRSGTSIRCYLNGTLGSTTTTSATLVNATTPLYLGMRAPGVDPYFNGYITNFRLVKGSALYTASSITVPTAPLTPVTNTQLLVGAVSGSFLLDSSVNSATPTQYGSGPTWNSLSPFATGLGYKNRVYTWTSSGSITF